MPLARQLARPLAGWLVFGVVMCLLPAFVSTGTVRILIFANFLAIFAMSWDVISGRTGYISFGHPFLIGIAASLLMWRFFDMKRLLQQPRIEVQ